MSQRAQVDVFFKNLEERIYRDPVFSIKLIEDEINLRQEGLNFCYSFRTLHKLRDERGFDDPGQRELTEKTEKVATQAIASIREILKLSQEDFLENWTPGSWQRIYWVSFCQKNIIDLCQADLAGRRFVAQKNGKVCGGDHFMRVEKIFFAVKKRMELFPVFLEQFQKIEQENEGV